MGVKGGEGSKRLEPRRPSRPVAAIVGTGEDVAGKTGADRPVRALGAGGCSLRRRPGLCFYRGPKLAGGPVAGRGEREHRGLRRRGAAHPARSPAHPGLNPYRRCGGADTRQSCRRRDPARWRPVNRLRRQRKPENLEKALAGQLGRRRRMAFFAASGRVFPAAFPCRLGPSGPWRRPKACALPPLAEASPSIIDSGTQVPRENSGAALPGLFTAGLLGACWQGGPGGGRCRRGPRKKFSQEAGVQCLREN